MLSGSRSSACGRTEGQEKAGLAPKLAGETLTDRGRQMPKEYKRRREDGRRSRALALAGRLATVPLAVLAAAALAFGQRAALPAAAAGALAMASYVLACVGMALSAGFNRSRVFVALLLLAAAQTVLSLPAPAGYDARMYATTVYYFAAVLLPLNILLFSLPADKGLLSPAGKAKLAFVAVQSMVAAVLVFSQDGEAAAFMARDSLALARYTPLPRTAAVLFAAAMILLALRQWRYRSPVDNALLFALAAQAAALHFRAEPLAVPLFFAAAAAMLTVAAIQDSHSIAYRDELTGLPSRRSLQEELARLGERYTLAMVDIDHFKRLNDLNGHAVGDDVLRLLAAILAEVPGGGRPFRYGGEEFTIVFAGKSLEEALPCLEEVRARVAERKFVVRGSGAAKRLTVTVSIGAAEGARDRPPGQVLKAADAALYRAKGQGRNRVCV
jgi:diguanylate cyclase (GGDEF)-like protein